MSQSSQIGEYSLLKQIGSGSTGTVWLAFDREQRTVAVKTLHPHLVSDPTMRRRLRREVATMQRIHHPAVAAVLDFDLDGDRPYLVTPLAQGRSLAVVVADKGPLEGEALRRTARGSAEALAAVHAAGVIHRDLTPANLVLSDGAPMIIDFGIAHVIDASRLTRHERRSGTLRFMAPELWAGEEATPAVDVFAWGATIAFAATGRDVFAGDGEFAIRRAIEAGAADLDGVPEFLSQVVAAALALDPGKRPAAADLPALLEAADVADVAGGVAGGGPGDGSTRPEVTRRDEELMGPLGRIGSYRLMSRLGSGGMGEVYLAEDPYGRRFALKTLLPHVLYDQKARQRLRREADALCRVRHPQVARLVRYDLDASPPYLVSEYVEGRTVAERVEDDGPLAEAELLALAEESARGLRAVHDAGVVHRDLAPSNLMIGPDGASIIDFGIAHETGATRLTEHGGRMGTPGYAAPELMAEGVAGQAGDVFVWACVIVFAATGRHAYPAPTPEARRRRMLSGKPDLDGLAGPLRDLLGEALVVDPEARPSAARLAARLAEIRNPQPEPRPGAVSAPPTERAETPPEPSRDADPTAVVRGEGVAEDGGERGKGPAAEEKPGSDDEPGREEGDGDSQTPEPSSKGLSDTVINVVMSCVLAGIPLWAGLGWGALAWADDRQNLLDVPRRTQFGPAPTNYRSDCVLVGCLGEEERESSELQYVLTSSAPAARTEFDTGRDGDRYLHAEPLIIRSTCGPKATVRIDVASLGGERRAFYVMLSEGTPRVRVGYASVGRPQRLQVVLRLRGLYPEGCGVMVALRNPYVHRFPPKAAMFAPNKEYGLLMWF